MLNNAIGQKVICSYRNNSVGWIGTVIEPDDKKDFSWHWSEREYCEKTSHTPILWPFGKMCDSDDSLTIITPEEVRLLKAGQHYRD